jgi:hypothetical protein
VSVPPGLVGLAGQFSVTTSRAVVCKGQVADALAVTGLAVQRSLPRAVTVLLTEQVPAEVRKLALKLADAPGARLATVNTVGGEDWLSVTVTLFSVMLPEFLTVPV